MVAKQFIINNKMITDKTLLNNISNIFPEIHSSVQDQSDKFFNSQNRMVYLTPKTFLDTLSLYKDLLNSKQDEL